jgi:hypothetical protein
MTSETIWFNIAIRVFQTNYQRYRDIEKRIGDGWNTNRHILDQSNHRVPLFCLVYSSFSLDGVCAGVPSPIFDYILNLFFSVFLYMNSNEITIQSQKPSDRSPNTDSDCLDQISMQSIMGWRFPCRWDDIWHPYLRAAAFNESVLWSEPFSGIDQKPSQSKKALFCRPAVKTLVFDQRITFEWSENVSLSADWHFVKTILWWSGCSIRINRQ